jgi:hypothetical protein
MAESTAIRRDIQDEAVSGTLHINLSSMSRGRKAHDQLRSSGSTVTDEGHPASAPPRNSRMNKKNRAGPSACPFIRRERSNSDNMKNELACRHICRTRSATVVHLPEFQEFAVIMICSSAILCHEGSDPHDQFLHSSQSHDAPPSHAGRPFRRKADSLGVVLLY